MLGVIRLHVYTLHLKRSPLRKAQKKMLVEMVQAGGQSQVQPEDGGDKCCKQGRTYPQSQLQGMGGMEWRVSEHWTLIDNFRSEDQFPFSHLQRKLLHFIL